MTPIRDELSSLLGKPPAPPKPVRKKRTLGNIYTALEAQRVFNPGMPSVPTPPVPLKPPSAAPANLGNKGTATALDNSGPWGGQAGEK